MKEHRVRSVENKDQAEYTKQLTLEMNRMERGGFSFTVEHLPVDVATNAQVWRAVLTGVREKPPVVSKPRPSKGGEAQVAETTSVSVN